MPSRDEWLQEQVAPTKEELEAGDGCHKDEAKAIGDYLDGKLTAQEAASAVTAPVLQEHDPPAHVYRLMGLLCSALVELYDDCEKLIDLVAAVQSLPPSKQIEWSTLPKFGSMWADLYRLHTHGPDPWEKKGLSDEEKKEFRRDYSVKGTVEARLFLRGVAGVTADWGYGILDLVCSGRAGVDVFITEMLAWLNVAGEELKKGLQSDQVRRWSGRVECTVGERWKVWKDAFLQLSKKDSSLSDQGRAIARDCYELM